MSLWQLANYGAWAVAGLIFFWLIRDFIQVNREYDEKVLLGIVDPMEDADTGLDKGGDVHE